MKTKHLISVCSVLLSAVLIFSFSGCRIRTSGSLSDDSGHIIPDSGGATSAIDSDEASENSPAANSSSGNRNNTDEKNESDKMSISDPYGNIPKSLKGTTVKYATWIEEYSTESGPVMEAFTAKTGIKVKLVSIPQHSYFTKLQAMVNAGNAPDVYCDTEEFPRLLPIAQPVENGGINLEDPIWSKEVVSLGTVNGKAYLLNTVGSIWAERDMVFFNKKLLEDNGIKTPADYMAENNWTWDTMREVMVSVKSLGYTGGYLDPQMLANSIGAGFIKYENGKFVNGSSDSKLAAAWTFYNQCIKDGLCEISMPSSRMADGDVGLMMLNAYGLKATGYFSSMDTSHIGFAEMPKRDKSQKDYTTSSTCVKAWGIVKGAENPKAAAYFIHYYLNPENYKSAGSYDSAFISEEAKEFFFEIANRPLDYMSIEPGVSKLSVSGKWGAYANIPGQDPAQTKTIIEANKNVVDNLVAQGNQLLSSIK